MAHHESLREHLVERAERGHPAVFQTSNDATLAEFGRIFTATPWYSFDANKHLPEDELSPLYELTTEIKRTAGAEPEQFSCRWAPVLPGRNLLLGFHHGPDSTLWGSTPVEFMPQDERTSALLLLVASDYVHLSASREQEPPLVRGAVNQRGEEFAYVTLAAGR